MRTLEVYPTLTLGQLRRHLNELFPYLQVEFRGVGNLSEKRIQEETMATLAGHELHSCFLIEGNMTVAELEEDFQDCFGLAIHVNRWTGYAWHDTDDTRHWTLNQQNQKGADVTLSGQAIC